KALAKKICDFKQTYTQYGGVRPFGTALLIGGVDDTGVHLFATDPSGAMMEYKATAEGEGRESAIEYFEKNYEENLSKEKAIKMGISAISYATEKTLEEKTVEIGIAEKDKKFEILSPEGISKYFEKKGE
ncbi:MAG TPA: proteasome subunit alpha, partial [Thermoplasmatales archaeon]|nr:proteasome subunit alpha [Thermoplasmatales archaeon]